MAKQIKGVDKLIKARSSLLLAEPWYGVPALSLRLVPRENDPVVWAMGTDGQNLYFNPDWVVQAPLDEIKGVIVHEVWHIWSKHDIRRGTRKHRKFNMAADYAINPTIRSAGYKLPANTLGNEYAGQAAEWIYDKLPDMPEWKVTIAVGAGDGGNGDNSNSQGDDPWDVGAVLDNPDMMAGKSPRDVEAQRNLDISNWYQNAKRAGQVPAELERIVSDLNKARMPWREILSRFLNTYANNDYDHAIPDPEYARYGAYMPSVRSEELGLVVYIGDTSGSIGAEQHKTNVSEMQGILRSYPGTQILALWVDHALHNPEWVSLDDVPLNVHPEGGGGTSFVPGFKYLEENEIEPVCVVYATDGYCNEYPDSAPGVPVLWLVIEKNDQFAPPFGEVVPCDFE
jgi:predicted metal-dependent peptidase